MDILNLLIKSIKQIIKSIFFIILQITKSFFLLITILLLIYMAFLLIPFIINDLKGFSVEHFTPIAQKFYEQSTINIICDNKEEGYIKFNGIRVYKNNTTFDKTSLLEVLKKYQISKKDFYQYAHFLETVNIRCIRKDYLYNFIDFERNYIGVPLEDTIVYIYLPNNDDILHLEKAYKEIEEKINENWYEARR